MNARIEGAEQPLGVFLNKHEIDRIRKSEELPPLDDMSFRISKLDVKSGDIVVLKFPVRLTTEVTKCVVEGYANAFPDLRFMVIHGGMDIAVLSKEQEQCETSAT